MEREPTDQERLKREINTRYRTYLDLDPNKQTVKMHIYLTSESENWNND